MSTPLNKGKIFCTLIFEDGREKEDMSWERSSQPHMYSSPSVQAILCIRKALSAIFIYMQAFFGKQKKRKIYFRCQTLLLICSLNK